MNHKRVYRLHRELGLAVRRKRRNRVAQANHQVRTVPEKANEPFPESVPGASREDLILEGFASTRSPIITSS